jgi:hippurate hydrolase
MSIRDDARALQHDLVRLRRAIHAEPEIGLDLPRTQDKILAALDGLPLEVRLGRKLSSVTAVLRGARPGPAVLLRGDMDALPLTERTGVDFASTVDGAMHACGHDLHTAMLAGAAHLLAGRRDDLAGDVVFMFQPGEEGCDGAAAMIAEGVLDAAGRRPHAAYALHVFTTGLRPGVVTARPGPIMASADGLDVRIVGAGGHGSMPHLARDPIPVACEIVTALQTLATRRADIFDPVVLTTGQFHAGTRRNIIPDTASFDVTFRAFSAATRQRIRAAAVELITSIAAGHGLKAEVDVVEGYPVTVNDAGETDFVAATVAEVLGEHRFALLPTPFAYAEDFSRILAEMPGTFVILGASPPGSDPDTVPNNHSAHVDFDDGLLADGATLYAELAARRLAAPS